MLVPGQHLVVAIVVAAAVGVAGSSREAARSARAEGSIPARMDAPGALAYGTYSWPVRGQVVRPYDPPDSPFGSGHRGIDIGVPLGTPVRASQTGTVAFAGPVAGALYVSIDHPDGIRTKRVDTGGGDLVELFAHVSHVRMRPMDTQR
jgi:murein DD-endopeptidase MepM/ murein hydrolase activator NlpD